MNKNMSELKKLKPFPITILSLEEFKSLTDHAWTELSHAYGFPFSLIEKELDQIFEKIKPFYEEDPK